MRIATADPPARPRRLLRRVDARQRRFARLEFLALAVVTAVITTGFWMTYQRQRQTFADVGAGLADGTLVQPGTSSTVAVAERLTMFAGPAERQFAADAVTQFGRERGGLTHVGALAAVTVPARDVRTNARLTTLRQRLA